MGLLIVLFVLVVLALTVPLLGADTRYPGSGDRPDSARHEKRYQGLRGSAIPNEVHRDQFDQTS